MDLNKLSRKELEKIIKDATSALKSIEKRELQEARKAAEQVAAKFGFKLSELTGNAGTARKQVKRASSGAAKYANPDDPSQTWTGKGRQPTWFKEAVAAGKSPESLEI